MARNLTIGIVATCALLFTSASAGADTISWYFDFFGTIGGSGFGSDSNGETAGAPGVVAPEWTGAVNSDPLTTMNLQDNSGNPTTMDVTRAHQFQFRHQASQPAQDADGTWNKAMLNGYINFDVTSVELKQIPYPNYDIYIYFGANIAGRQGNVTDGTTTYYFKTYGAASIAGANAIFAPTIQTTDLGSGNVTANYAVFSGLSGSSQTVTVTIPSFGGISGVQVSGVIPEPTTFVLGIAGLAALVGIHWRRRNR